MNEISPAAAAEVQLVCQYHNYAADGFYLLAHMVLKDVVQWKQCGEALLPKLRVLRLLYEDLLIFQMMKILRNLTF